MPRGRLGLVVLADQKDYLQAPVVRQSKRRLLRLSELRRDLVLPPALPAGQIPIVQMLDQQVAPAAPVPVPQTDSASLPMWRSGRRHSWFARAPQMGLAHPALLAVQRPTPPAAQTLTLAVRAGRRRARQQGRQTDWVSGPVRQAAQKRRRWLPRQLVRRMGLPAELVVGKHSPSSRMRRREQHLLPPPCIRLSGSGGFCPHRL